MRVPLILSSILFCSCLTLQVPPATNPKDGRPAESPAERAAALVHEAADTAGQLGIPFAGWVEMLSGVALGGFALNRARKAAKEAATAGAHQEAARATEDAAEKIITTLDDVLKKLPGLAPDQCASIEEYIKDKLGRRMSDSDKMLVRALKARSITRRA